MKRKKDPGLEYMLSLGFNPAKSISGVEQQLTAASNKEKAASFIELLTDRAIRNRSESAKHAGPEQMYEIKNETLEFSLALSSAYDGDILRKACNWIDAHKDHFGKTILEVGCDCGVMSCFLAKVFPDSRITSIDRCEPAIINARQLAARLNVTNVTFITQDLKDVEGQFDTVFSMRTVHENNDAVDDAFNELDVQAELFREALVPYAKALKSKLSDQGILISIERIGRNALLLGWLEALYDAGLFFDLRHYEELKCSELGEESCFQAFLAFQSKRIDCTPTELFDYACSKYLDYSAAQYEDHDAKIVFANRRGKMIEGYLVDYPHLKSKVKTSIWTHNTDESGLIFYQNNNGHSTLQFYDISQLEELRQSLQNALYESRVHGGDVTPL